MFRSDTVYSPIVVGYWRKKKKSPVILHSLFVLSKFHKKPRQGFFWFFRTLSMGGQRTLLIFQRWCQNKNASNEANIQFPLIFLCGLTTLKKTPWKNLDRARPTSSHLPEIISTASEKPLFFSSFFQVRSPAERDASRKRLLIIPPRIRGVRWSKNLKLWRRRRRRRRRRGKKSFLLEG